MPLNKETKPNQTKMLIISDQKLFMAYNKTTMQHLWFINNYINREICKISPFLESPISDMVHSSSILFKEDRPRS